MHMRHNTPLQHLSYIFCATQVMITFAEFLMFGHPNKKEVWVYPSPTIPEVHLVHRCNETLYRSQRLYLQNVTTVVMG